MNVQFIIIQVTLATDNFGSENDTLKDKEKIKNELIENWKKYTNENNCFSYKELNKNENMNLK